MALAIEPKVVRWPGVVVLAVVLMLLGFAASEWLKPRRVVADELPPINLAVTVPPQFGDWHEYRAGPQVVTDPTLEATLQQFYSETLNRTYVNSKGQIIMMALAYGKNQNSWNTAAHRPEFCYSAQGFEVSTRGTGLFSLDGRQITANRLVAKRGRQIEPITYWVTLHDTTAVPGLSRKIQQIRYGLQGMIVDGLLVRISSLGGDEADQFALHEAFARDLEQALSVDMRPRLFGAK